MSSYNQYYKDVAPIFNTIRMDQEVEINVTMELFFKYHTKKGGLGLDLGCGTGRYSKYLNSRRFKMLGLDLSIHQLQNAPSQVYRINGDAKKMPFRNRVFSFALMLLVIQQIQPEDRPIVFENLNNILENDGLYIIKTCSHDDLRKRTLGEFFPSALPINLKRYPDIDQLSTELRNAGFEVVDVVPTCTEHIMSVSDMILRIKNKHNTTLSLIPDDEFRKGYKLLQDHYRGKDEILKKHRHTVVIARKTKKG